MSELDRKRRLAVETLENLNFRWTGTEWRDEVGLLKQLSASSRALAQAPASGAQQTQTPNHQPPILPFLIYPITIYSLVTLIKEIEDPKTVKTIRAVTAAQFLRSQLQRTGYLP